MTELLAEFSPAGYMTDTKLSRVKPIPLFVIRLITRLIFCWFLQEKGLMPRDLFRRHAVEQMLKDFSTDSGTYYKAVLQNLFFATLNQEVQERGFRSYNQRGGT